MARIRSIKPDFFMHEELAELPPLTRLFFIGLWTLADKQGRLEDRPKRIKAAILPWEDCDVDEILWSLSDAGFIRRYEAKDVACIEISGFGKHQRPHPRESSYDLPDPKEGKSREKVLPGRESPRQAVKRQPSIPAWSAGKEILDNGSLVSGGGERDPGNETAPPASPPPPKKPRAPSQAQAFFRWCQEDKEENGKLPKEPEPNPQKLNSWFVEFSRFAPDERAQQDAWCSYAAYDAKADLHWKAKNFPFAGFMSSWRDHIKPKATAPPEGRCQIEGCDAREVVNFGYGPICYAHHNAGQRRPLEAVT